MQFVRVILDGKLSFRINMQLMKFLFRWTSGDKVLQSEAFILLTIYGDCRWRDFVWGSIL